jgi:predicted Zn-dependent peptidase
MPVKGNDDVYEYGGSQKEPKIKIKKQNTQQINLSVGFRGYGYNHKDFYTLKLLGVILGGSMSSRLFISVRERKGLAYQVHTQVESYADSGYLTTNIGTSSDKVKEAIKTTLLEYKKIININVGSQELKKAKDYIKGKTVLNLEPSDDLNTWIVKQELLQKEVLDTTKLFKIIDGITSKDIRRVAREVFIKDNLNLAIIGPDFDERELKSILKF